MSPASLLVVLLLLSSFAYYLGRRRAFAVAGKIGGSRHLHSRPTYYGSLTALSCAVPALLVFGAWIAFEDNVITSLVLSDLPESFRNLPEERLSLVINDIRNLVNGNIVSSRPEPSILTAAARYREYMDISHKALTAFTLSAAGLSMVVVARRISPALRARNHVERVFVVFLVACSTLAIFTTVGIVFSVLFEALRFFKAVPLSEFLFGLQWSPQIAIRADQVGASGAFGAVPVFVGTLLITLIAMVVAVPIGLFSAIYLSEYAHRKFRDVAKPLLEILAGIPTVVYGFFAALMVAPFVRRAGEYFGLDVASESALAAGLVMGIMIIPFVSSLSDDVINAVPQSLRDGAYSLGATQSETIKHVVLPAALPGIVGSILLAVSRAIGETMIVVMAAGLAANLTFNPLKAVTTVTVQIVTLLIGDQEFDSPKTLAAFALGLVLFLVTLVLNIIALHVVRRYREQYE
ncbi:MAG: phosphate ABC transporter permease subunit PstC [Thermodesulfobacteriota bacterium]|nr:phosphate ABC transporter permease subunit PstC [Thermodesulfobacteriota bacterium]